VKKPKDKTGLKTAMYDTNQIRPIATGLMPSSGLCREISLRAASGRYRKRYDLGVICRTELDRQTHFPALTFSTGGTGATGAAGARPVWPVRTGALCRLRSCPGRPTKRQAPRWEPTQSRWPSTAPAWWTVNWLSANVTKVQASDGAVLGTFPVGRYPRGMAFDGFRIWVANFGTNTVSKI